MSNPASEVGEGARRTAAAPSRRGLAQSSRALVFVAAMLAAPIAVGEEPPAASSLLAEGRKAFDAKRFDDARASFVKAAEAAKASGDASSEAEGLALAARTFIAVDRLDESKPWLERAQKVASPERPLGWSTYLAVRARLAWKSKELEKATKDLEALHAYCVEHGLHERAVDAANLAVLTGTPEQKLVWAKRGIEAAEKGGLDGWLGPLWNNLGAAHEDAGRYADAVAAYRKARDAHWKTGGETQKLIADWAVGHALRLAGSLDEASSWLRPALAWAERRFAASASPDDGEWVGWVEKDLGQVEAAQGRRDSARELLGRAKKHLGDAKMETWDEKGWKELLGALAAAEEKPK